MTEAEVLQAANTAASAEGFRLNEYRAPDIRFEFYERDRSWTVMYNLRIPAPWDPPIPAPQSAHGAPRHFTVTVDDKTRRTRLAILRQTGPSQPVKLPPGVKVLGPWTQGVERPLTN